MTFMSWGWAQASVFCKDFGCFHHRAGIGSKNQSSALSTLATAGSVPLTSSTLDGFHT